MSFINNFALKYSNPWNTKKREAKINVSSKPPLTFEREPNKRLACAYVIKQPEVNNIHVFTAGNPTALIVRTPTGGQVPPTQILGERL